MTPQLRFMAAGLTHEGLVRSHNEDAHLLRPDMGLWAVADGMGGHENGQWASAAIVRALSEVTASGDFETDVTRVRQAVEAANGEIVAEAESAGRRMGSTLVILMASGRRFACLWAGDSRIYRLREGALSQLTRDHTQVQDMIDDGRLSPEEAEHHPMGHVLSRAVGVEQPLKLDAVTGELGSQDIFLLCSDGLSGVVTDEELRAHLDAADPRTAGKRLLDLVLERGAPDNVTLVTVACEEMTALTIAGDA